MKKKINDSERLLMKNIHLYQRFKKSNFDVMINENFVFDLFVIKKVLTKSLKSSLKLFNFDENTEVILSSMI